MHQTAHTSNIRLIAVDMDGTLLGEDGQISPRNIAALSAAQAAGVEIVVATGRRHSYAMRILRPLALPHSGALISSNGAVTRTVGSFGGDARPSQLIARTHLTRATTLWLCDHLRGSGDDNLRKALVLTFDRVGPDGDDSRGALVVEDLDYLNGSIGRWMIANMPYIALVNPIERALDSSAMGQAPDPDFSTTDLNHHAPIQAMLCGTVDSMARAEARLLEHPGVQASDHPAGRSGRTTNSPTIPGAPFVTVPTSRVRFAQSVKTSSSAPMMPLTSSVRSEYPAEPILTLHRTVYPGRDLSILDILPPNCSKGEALLTFAATRGIEPAEIMAIGDNWNDVSMLEIAGQSVLMANAPDDLKALARTRHWRIGLPNTADGAAEAIESALTVARA